MIRHFRTILFGFLALWLVGFQASTWAQRLVDSGQELPGLWAGGAAWADFDGDGDLDLALMGEGADDTGQLRPVARIYGNFADGLFSESQTAGQQLVGAYFGELAWADFDGDGDLDLAIAGWDERDQESLRLYANDPSDLDSSERLLRLDRRHVDESGASVLKGVRYAALAWGDYDGDGDLDLIVSGMEENGTSLTRLYRNAEGVLQPDEANSETVVDLHNGDLAWGDYDNDGDLDLAVAGENVTTTGGLRAVTEFYRNEPTGTLALDGALSVGAQVKGGALAWTDYDGDGNLDLAVSGRQDDWNTSFLLYRNRPSGVLSQDDRFRLAATRRIAGSVAWGDYDNDGDLDLAASGRSILSEYQSFVFTNEAGQISGLSSESALEGLAGGTTAWGDYDRDGDLDLLICGVDAQGQGRTLLYDNQGTLNANHPPDPPVRLNPPTVTGHRVLFSWVPGGDQESENLTYNLRVGTEEGGNDILSGAISPGPGNVGFKTNRILERSLAPDVYYWNVQTVDGGLAVSEWMPQDGIFNVQQFVSSRFATSGQSLRALQQAAMDWGDYDGDGDYDLAITGQNRSGAAQSLLYENAGGELKVVADAGLVALRNGDVAWGDYNRDGYLDLLLTGEDTFKNKRTLLYASAPAGSGRGLQLIGQFPSLSWSAADWGDFDGDGDLDLAVMGLSDDVIGGRQQAYTWIYENEGGESFVLSDQELIGLHNGDIAWGDIDGDGDPDLAVNGVSGEGVRDFRVYRNEAGRLIDAEEGLTGLESSSLAWGDFDGDGDLDLAAGGISAEGIVTVIYVNDGSGRLSLLAGTDFTGIRGGDLAWGDYDNDRDLDLIVTGNDGQKPVLIVYENTDAGFVRDNILVLQGLDFSAVSLADYDGDGDLDLFSSGRDANLVPQATVNDNLEGQFNANRPPETPRAIGAADSADVVSLSWEQAVDDGDDTPLSLTYNVRVGTEPKGDDVLSGNAPLGSGNAGHSLFRRLRGLVSGTYYWSVQTVDDGFARSAWSAPRSFIIDTAPPQVAEYTLNRRELGIGQTVTLALNLFDEHAGVDAAVEPEVTAVVGGQSYPFETLQFTGATWNGSLTIGAEMPSGGVDIAVRGVVDNKGNQLVPFDASTAFVIDTDLPAVASSSPAAGATGVSMDLDEVSVTFSEPLEPSTVNAENFEIELGNQILTQIPQPRYDAETHTVRIFPLTGILIPGSNYKIEISAAIQDLAGNRPANVILLPFSTQVPQLMEVSPAAGDTLVAAGEAALVAIFDAPLLESALDDAQAVQILREGQPVRLRGRPQFDAQSFELTFEAEGGLRPGTRYEVVVSGALAGPLRVQGEGDFRWSFQTVAPELVEASPEGLVGAATRDIRAVFSSPIDVGLLSAETVHVFCEGEAVSIASGSLRFDGGTNALSFELAEGLKPGSRYEVVLDGRLAGSLRVQGGGDFSWKFQMPVPVLTATRPVADADSLGTGDATITATFDNPIDMALLTPENMVVFKGGVEIAIGDPEYNPETRVVRFAVDEGLRAGTSYQVRIAAAVGGPLRGSDYAWRFSTAVPRVTGLSPESGSSGVGIELAEAVVDFSVALDAGQAVASNFALLREGEAVLLREGDPRHLGEGRYALAPAGGWRVGSRYAVQISPSVSGPLGAGQAIDWSFQTTAPELVSASPAAGDTAVSPQVMAVQARFDAPIDVGLLRAAGGVQLLQEGRSIEIEALSYDPDNLTVTFEPQDGLRAGTSYQAQIAAAVGGPLRREKGAFGWDFSTRVPAVVSVEPAAGAQVRSGARRIRVVFSSPIDADLVTPQNFRLSRNGVAVDLDAGEYDPGEYDSVSETHAMRFPAVDLLPGSLYQASVSSRVGGPLGTGRPDLEWNFRTQVPQLVSTWPPDGEDGVSTSAPAIQVVFSEPVASRDAALFQLVARALGDTAATPELVTITSPSVRDSGDAVILSFAPEGGFKPFTEYQATVDRQVLGELAAAGFSWTFRTAARLAEADRGGTVVNASRSVELYFPPNALEGGVGEVLIRRLSAGTGKWLVQGEGLTRVSALYEIAAAGALLKPVTLTMRYTAAELDGREKAKLGIFRQDGSQWRRIGGAPVESEFAVRTTVDAFGVFALFEDTSTPVGALAVRELDCQPRAFSPTGSRDKAETDISFELTQPADVTVRVYNTSGRLERVIVREQSMAPGRIALQWDGRDEDRETVASGLYIIVVNAGDARQEKVVAVVR